MTDEKECNKDFMNTGTWVTLQLEIEKREKNLRRIRTVDEEGNAFDENGKFITKLY